MGIRIHKCLCYALNDVQMDNFDIVDPRFDPKVNSEDFRENFSSEEELNKFLFWVWENRNGLVAELLKQAKGIASNESPRIQIDLCFDWALRERFEPKESDKEDQKIKLLSAHNVCVHQREYGLPNVFGFVEVTNAKWFRYDDNIDYYENAAGPEENRGSDTLVEVPYGFYPYSGMMFRKALPEIEETPIPESIKVYIQKSRGREGIMASEFSMLVGTWSRDKQPIAGQDAADYMKKCYRPEIPDSILLYSYYHGFFKDWVRTVQDLKPYIYTYWS